MAMARCVCPKWGIIVPVCYAHLKKQFHSMTCAYITWLYYCSSPTRFLYSMLSLNIGTDVYDLGSMADVPKDLLQEIKRLEEMFMVPAEKLKSITTHFVSELEKGKFFITTRFNPSNIKPGLSVEGGSIVRTLDFPSPSSIRTMTDSGL
jgi:hypothetical protein